MRDRDDFDDLRAERDIADRIRREPSRFNGLWKQIALGIVVGYGVLGIASALAWIVITQIALGDVSFQLR